MLYVLTYEGVYRHNILGIFNDKDRAVAEAEVLIMKEKDGYHDIHLSKCEMNTSINDVETIIVFRRSENESTLGHKQYEKITLT